MSSQDLPKPDYAKNIKLIGYTDQGGRPDGVQMMVNKGSLLLSISCGYNIKTVHANL